MKNIVIIGAGISGLSALHFLSQRYHARDDLRFILVEQNAHCGGTIRTLKRNGCLFETGANGFLDNKPKS